MELQTGPSFSLGSAWLTIDQQRKIPLTFRQKIWYYLNMDVRDLWRLIYSVLTRTWHRRTG